MLSDILKAMIYGLLVVAIAYAGALWEHRYGIAMECATKTSFTAGDETYFCIEVGRALRGEYNVNQFGEAKPTIERK